MLEKDGNYFTAQCDFCSHIAETDCDDWHSAIEQLKLNGWNVFKKMGEWFHRCDACETGADAFDDVS